MTSLILVGCGKMGGAMLSGWLETGFVDEAIHVIEPNPTAVDQFANSSGVTIVKTAYDIPEGVNPSVVILAVKPQTMDDAIIPLKRFVGPNTVFLSIAAGKTIRYFEDKLGQKAAIVRAMPNTPASVGRGVTVFGPHRGR